MARLQAVSPGAVDAAVRAKHRLASLGGGGDLREEVARLRAEVAELRHEIDESRRDARRIAELTDIVEHRLATPKES